MNNSGLRWNDLPALERIWIEDVLRAILECEYQGQGGTDAQLSALSGAGLERTLSALGTAQRLQLVRHAAEGWRLTDSGRAMAVRVMRAHRLTETDLARNSSMPPGLWHDHAHAAEHELTQTEIDHLADRLGNPRYDPHGDPIPTREGTLPQQDGIPLMAWPQSKSGVIAHIEDEPARLFTLLADRGIFADMRVKKLSPDEVSPVLLSIEGRMTEIAAEQAALIRVRSMHEDEALVPEGACRLSEIPDGKSAEVLALLPGCRGAERSRLLDLGLVPGSRIDHAFDSPFHSPAAYRVRGTLIALRETQADQVLVKPISF